MAEAARKLASRQTYEPRPDLRVVTAKPRSAARRSTRARGVAPLFRVCILAMVLLSGLALLRVSLAVGAEQDAIDATSLQSQIKSEQQAAKSLEASKSTLAAPSRIASIASNSLNMKAPAKVAYMTLGTSKKTSSGAVDGTRVASAASTSQDSLSSLKKVVSSLMDVAAGEAQVLLVGDVGLASAK